MDLVFCGDLTVVLGIAVWRRGKLRGLEMALVFLLDSAEKFECLIGCEFFMSLELLVPEVHE